jgi:hypothetical protein
LGDAASRELSNLFAGPDLGKIVDAREDHPGVTLRPA